MTNLSRRSFLAGVAAVMGGFLLPGCSGESASGAAPSPYIRYNVNTAQGQLMLGKLANAIEIMKSDTYAVCDPHSYTFQWYTHWTEQYQAFQYQNSTNYKEQYIQEHCTGQNATLAEAMWNGCQAHGIDNSNPEHFQEWYFPPWHRFYLYYFEQIVQDVLKDETFSLPYWNPASGVESDLSIPTAFQDSSSPLYDSTRYSPINKGTRIDHVVLAPNWLTVNCLNEPSYISSATGGYGFCPGVDINPHFLVHIGLGGDMSDGFNTVVKDPIFWVHHANIDRLWESWNRLGGINPTDSNWLTRSFTWANGNGNPVTLPVSAGKRTAQLGYEYDSYSVPPKQVSLSQRDLKTARQMPEVMVASVTGGPVLGSRTSEVVLPLPMGDRKGMPLADRVEALAPGRQIYLVLKEMHANPETTAAYGVYFDLPKGAALSGGSEIHLVGALPVMRGQVHGGCHSDKLHDGGQIAFNITETLLKLNKNKMLGAKENTISIIANEMSGAKGVPVVGQIALIER